MALPTLVILQGRVHSTNERSGIAKVSGNPYTLRTAIVIGDPTMGEVTLSDDVELTKGQTVTLLCEAGAYNSDEQLRVRQVLDAK